ncbi:MAG: hypothetical protein ACK559_00375, partial [bacterium]
LDQAADRRAQQDELARWLDDARPADAPGEGRSGGQDERRRGRRRLRLLRNGDRRSDDAADGKQREDDVLPVHGVSVRGRLRDAASAGTTSDSATVRRISSSASEGVVTWVTRPSSRCAIRSAKW